MVQRITDECEWNTVSVASFSAMKAALIGLSLEGWIVHTILPRNANDGSYEVIAWRPTNLEPKRA